jgi:hypothetical protein
VDTQLDPIAVEDTLGNRELVTPVCNVEGSAVTRPARAKLSAEALRPVRIALAEYARTSGMYDPLDVVVFTKMCIQEASVRVRSANITSADALLKESLKVAATSCGVCRQPLNQSVLPAPSDIAQLPINNSLQLPTAIAARMPQYQPLVPVPPLHGRSMPPQSLGELPDIRPTTLWNSLMQLMWRSVGTLLTAMFARSE